MNEIEARDASDLKTLVRSSYIEESPDIAGVILEVKVLALIQWGDGRRTLSPASLLTPT